MNYELFIALDDEFIRYMKPTQIYSQGINPDSSSDGCSLPASPRTVGGTLSTGTTRVTHGDMCRKQQKIKTFYLAVELLTSTCLWSLSHACGTFTKRQETKLVGVSSDGDGLTVKFNFDYTTYLISFIAN